jgi:hypothetical protein
MIGNERDSLWLVRLTPCPFDRGETAMAWDIFTFLEFVAVSLVGALVAFLVLVVQKKVHGTVRLKRADTQAFTVDYLPIVIVAIVVGTVSVAFTTLLPQLFAPQILGPGKGWLDQIQWSYVIAFTSMLVGMTASYFNRLINERRAKIDELQKKGDPSRLDLNFDLWDFVQPLFVSVLTFGAIVARVNSSEFFTNVLLGFETGFFWQTILARRATN